MTSAQHFQRAADLQEWGMSLWWTGLACLTFAGTALVLGHPLTCALTVILYMPISMARDACFQAADQHLCAASSRCWSV